MQRKREREGWGSYLMSSTRLASNIDLYGLLKGHLQVLESLRLSVVWKRDRDSNRCSLAHCWYGVSSFALITSISHYTNQLSSYPVDHTHIVSAMPIRLVGDPPDASGCFVALASHHRIWLLVNASPKVTESILFLIDDRRSLTMADSFSLKKRLLPKAGQISSWLLSALSPSNYPLVLL